MRKTGKQLLLASVLLWTTQACSQVEKDTLVKKSTPDTSRIAVNWQEMLPGLWLAEADAPVKSVVNDSRLTIIKLAPQYFEFDMKVATELDRKAHAADEWAAMYDYQIVFNAGMYDLAKKLISRGYLQHGKHRNQAELHPTFNSMLAFGAKDSTKNAPIRIFDLKCSSFEQIKKQYNSLAQGLRMLDCEGGAIGWNKRKQSCSMLACAQDPEGMFYLIFCRSPYTHNQFISFLQKMPFKLINAIYMEGGPETSLYLRVGDFCMDKVGSYVSPGYENDLNAGFWALPNIIGLRYKGQIPATTQH